MIRISFVVALFFYTGMIFGQGAEIILNEYNAVDGKKFLNGGNSESDCDGGKASDDRLGRTKGNGGDWFELVVIKDHLDIRGWCLDFAWDDGKEKKKVHSLLHFTENALWSDLRSGTIITVSELIKEDTGYDPVHGDWWINVMAHREAGSRLYIEKKNFTVNAKNWQLTIIDKGGRVKFGPAGEGVSPKKGVDDEKIFRLEADPSASITPDSKAYDAAKDRSTFGAPNAWADEVQDFGRLRSVVRQAH
jgi:hypothetical protein